MGSGPVLTGVRTFVLLSHSGDGVVGTDRREVEMVAKAGGRRGYEEVGGVVYHAKEAKQHRIKQMEIRTSQDDHKVVARVSRSNGPEVVAGGRSSYITPLLIRSLKGSGETT